MAIQARIPPALCAIHNFIRLHDADEIYEFNLDVLDQTPGEFCGELAEGPALRAEKDRAELLRDNIAQAMWESYQALVNDGMHDGEE